MSSNTCFFNPAFNLAQTLDPQLGNPQHGELQLAPNSPDPSIPPLRLLLDSDRLALMSDNNGSTLEYPLIYIPLLSATAFERIISTTNACGAVETKYVARCDAGHAEGKTERVACCQKVRAGVNVCRYEVGRLGGEKWEEFAE